ncbi:MAG TPA: YabP/YqfC family sporulation protein [Candidatus Borkfalkia stercoripullorum]|nr:YabP/YqfC family sporulation protein [Candidatus Borkfalkia stercoripullorum]
MRLFEEIVSRLGLDEEVASGEKYVVFPGRCAYFEGVKGIRSFSSSAVEVLMKSGAYRAEGEGLKVARYGGGDLMLLGNVLKVEAIV